MTPPSTQMTGNVAQIEVPIAVDPLATSLRSQLASSSPLASHQATGSLRSSLIASAKPPPVKRPTSVTVIAWILIVSGGFNLVMTAVGMGNPLTNEFLSKSPLPISAQYAMAFISLAITLGAGIAMLKGQNWGRLTYVISCPIFFIVGVVTSPIKAMLIPGFILFLVAAFFLFRPKATEYFAAETPSKYA